MFIKSINFLFFVCLFAHEAISQGPNISKRLKCYHCDFDCALVKNEPEELKHCDSVNELCMRGTIKAEGNTVQVSGCHLAQGKAGKCEKINIMNVESEVCYCDTDGCNGTSNIQPQSLTVLLAIAGILMMLGFK